MSEWCQSVKQFKYFGHTTWHNSLLKNVLERKVAGNHVRGKKCCMSSIKRWTRRSLPNCTIKGNNTLLKICAGKKGRKERLQGVMWEIVTWDPPRDGLEETCLIVLYETQLWWAITTKPPCEDDSRWS